MVDGCKMFKYFVIVYFNLVAIVHSLFPGIKFVDWDGSHAHNSTIYDTCNAYMYEFDVYISKFINCAILNARPFRLCEDCAEFYLKSLTVYEDLQSDDGRWSRCESLLLDADVVQVIWRTHKFVVNLWNVAQCRNCYSILQESPVNGSVTAKLSTDVEKFFDLYNATLTCFNISEEKWPVITTTTPLINGTSPVCKRCAQQYNDMGEYFTNMAPSSMCMDLVDIMNYTRLMWSKKYFCSHRSADDWHVIAIIVVLYVILISFYVGNRIHGDRPIHRIVRQKRLKQQKSPTYLTDSNDTDGSLGHSSVGTGGVVRRSYGATDTLN